MIRKEPKTIVSFSVTEAVLEEIDKLSEETGFNRAQICRTAVLLYLESRKVKTDDRAAM